MGRPLRYVPPGRPLEVTNRTFQGRYLLLPRGEVRALVLGALGRAQRRYGMPIHAFTFASNHLLCAAAHKKCYVEPRIMWSH